MASVSLIVPIAPGRRRSWGGWARSAVAWRRRAMWWKCWWWPILGALRCSRVSIPACVRWSTSGPARPRRSFAGCARRRAISWSSSTWRKATSPRNWAACSSPWFAARPTWSSPGPTGRARSRAVRRGGWHALLRPLIGITDPSSGLVAVTRACYEARSDHLAPLGGRFVLELLVGSVGRLVEVPLQRSARRARWCSGPSDLRLIKRLADDRFGNFSRLLQFCVVGASGMVIDLTCYALLQLWLSRTFLAGMKPLVFGSRQSLDLAVAGALAIAIALVWNFSLNRRLTFNDARQGSILRQFATYAAGQRAGHRAELLAPADLAQPDRVLPAAQAGGGSRRDRGRDGDQLLDVAVGRLHQTLHRARPAPPIKSGRGARAGIARNESGPTGNGWPLSGASVLGCAAIAQ